MTGKQIQELLLKEGIEPSTVEHRGAVRIKLSFPLDERITSAVKQLPGRRWSKTMKAWHIPKEKKLLEQLLNLLKHTDPGITPDVVKATVTISTPENAISKALIRINGAPPNQLINQQRLNNSQKLALNAYIEMLRLKNYSYNTLKNYRGWFIMFMNYFPNRKPSTITKNEIMDFLVHFRNSSKWSATSQNQLVNAIKFFFEKLLNRSREVYELPRAKKPYQLPTIFSAEEIKRMILSPSNIKHRTILCVAYAGGLRISEIVNLKIHDIDASRMVMTLRGAKGKKDRQVMLSDKLLDILRTYYAAQEIKPRKWVFEGANFSQYSMRSIQEIMKRAKADARINKKGSIHALRHSFATHLLESGTDILTIKELLGHSNIKTTLNYTHVSVKHISKVQSPLDKIAF